MTWCDEHECPTAQCECASEPPSATVPTGAEAMAPAKKPERLTCPHCGGPAQWVRDGLCDRCHEEDARTAEVASLRASLARSIPVEEVEALVGEWGAQMEWDATAAAFNDRRGFVGQAQVCRSAAMARTGCIRDLRALAARHGATTGGGR